MSAVAEAAQLADSAQSPDEVLASKQVERALDQAIGALDPMYREVLILRDFESLTAQQVAEVLGISVQAIESRLHRARVAVRDSVAPILGVPSDASAAPSTCPGVLTLFSQHLEHEISADVCREIERHIESCPRCRGACASLKRTLALRRTSGASVEVPAAVQSAVKQALQACFLRENPCWVELSGRPRYLRAFRRVGDDEAVEGRRLLDLFGAARTPRLRNSPAHLGSRRDYSRDAPETESVPWVVSFGS
jgi:hypothetical protein